MKELAKRVWNEPAVAIGLLGSIALALINVAGDQDWNAEHIIAIVAPLLSGLGIRPLVTPTSKLPAGGGTSSPRVVSSSEGDAAV